MNIVVVGYGRVGSALARELASAGHQVTVIDNQAARVQRAVRLPQARVVTGNAVDVQVQREAGVASADIFLAVTANDNVNLVAAQIALEVFQVAHVIARVYAPSRADVSASRGITTICPTRYTIEALWERVREVAGEAVPRAAPIRRSGRARMPFKPVDEAKFVVVAGGGRVGFHLARSLLSAGHEVALIERDPARAGELSHRIDCPIIVGDSSMTPVLEEAGSGRCRVFCAVTGRDEDNLVACQTVRGMRSTAPGTPQLKTIARISDPNNEDLYKALGVDATVSATSIIQHVVERELPTLSIKTLLSIQGGGAHILEVTLPVESPVADHMLRDVVLPRDCNIIAILRDTRTVIPRGDTVFKVGDVVLALVSKESEEDLKSTILAPPPPAPGEEHGDGESEASLGETEHDEGHAPDKVNQKR
jgi:trk system potassium uptake protein TrkA